MAYREIPIPSGSSNVERVEYDDKTGDLRITYLRSTIPYTFEGVPGTVADGFTTSGLSAGQYFLQAIKGQFVFSRG